MESRIDLLGKWPLSGEEARENNRLIYIPQDKMLQLIHGKNNHFLVSFFISNDFVNFGIMDIPKGIYSEPEVHKGDEVLFILEGTLIVKTYEQDNVDKNSVLHETFEINEGEQFLMPEGIIHKYLNFSNKVVKALFGIAPQL